MLRRPPWLLTSTLVGSTRLVLPIHSFTAPLLMPPSSTPDTEPSTALTLAAATDPSSGTHTTAIIIGVSVGAGCLILIIAGYRLWKCLPRRSKAPLPPKGPLAHDRQRQMAPAHPGPALDYPHPTEVPPFPRHIFSGPANFHRHRSDRTDDTSNTPSPSVIDSQVHLVQTPTGSEETVEMPRPGHGSFNSSPTARHNYLPRRQRTRSVTGSVHSTRSRMSSTSATIRGRGPPHARHSRVDVVLPQPLAPGLYNANSVPGPSRFASHSRASSRERSESREDYAMGASSMDRLPMQPAEINYYHPGRYPPPVPPMPTGYHTPHPSDATSPSSAAPFLTQPAPSPERGPPPLPPPKDAPSRSSRRPPSDSNHRNQ